MSKRSFQEMALGSPLITRAGGSPDWKIFAKGRLAEHCRHKCDPGLRESTRPRFPERHRSRSSQHRKKCRMPCARGLATARPPRPCECGGRPSRRLFGPTAPQRLLHPLDQHLIFQQRIDAPQFRIPQLLAVGRARPRRDRGIYIYSGNLRNASAHSGRSVSAPPVEVSAAKP